MNNALMTVLGFMDPVLPIEIGAGVDPASAALDQAFYYVADLGEFDDAEGGWEKAYSEAMGGAMAQLGLKGDDPVLYIGGIEISSEKRGQGHGKRTVQALENWARQQGAIASVLFSTATTGGPSEGFWRHVGYDMLYEVRYGGGVMGKRLR